MPSTTTKYIVDNQAGQTIDGEPILKPYKVYTALLTQSGGNSQFDINSGSLTIGVSYQIKDTGALEPPFITWDFTNVGAPDNEIGTYFVATGTTPNNWGNGTLTYNTGAPVTTVLENTIGNIWFTYANSGVYVIRSLGLFDPNKTFSFAASVNDTPQGTLPLPVTIDPAQSTVDELPIKVWSTSEGTGRNYLYNTSIEIRVYN